MSAEVHTHFAIPDGVSLSASASVNGHRRAGCHALWITDWQIGRNRQPTH